MRTLISRFVITTSLAALSLLSASAASSAWKIDPAHSAAQFSVRHLAISNVRGEFSKVSGTLLLDDADVSRSSLDVSIDTTTVDTREPDRDKDLRSDHFLDVAHYPTMTFKSTRIERASPGKLKVTGDFTLHGVTKQVTLDVSGPSAVIKDPWGMRRRAVSATTSINRQDFGVKWNAHLDSGGVVVGDNVDITLDVEMVQPAAGK